MGWVYEQWLDKQRQANLVEAEELRTELLIIRNLAMGSLMQSGNERDTLLKILEVTEVHV